MPETIPQLHARASAHACPDRREVPMDAPLSNRTRRLYAPTLRTSLSSIVTLRAALLLALAWVAAACEPTQAGYQPKQPIAYSHALHAGVLQISCQYCHYGAERGRYAGIPPAQVCMNCHSQVGKDKPEVKKLLVAVEKGEPIKWVRIHRLPDHVYFNHSAHVVTGKLACQKCHDNVQAMGRLEHKAPLTMGWCLDCHRTGGKGPIDEGHPRVNTHLTDCVTCHH